MTGSKWIAPWRWAPLIVLLTMRMNLSDLISIGGYCLIIPIGAHLVQHYGRTGFVVLALGGLPLLGYVPFHSIASTANSGVYLSAVLIGGWLLKSSSTPLQLPRLRLGTWVYLCFLILPLHMGLGSAEIPELGEIRWELDGLALLFLLVWALGMSRVPTLPVLIGLGITMLFGMTLEYASLPSDAAVWIGANRAELPWLGLTELRPLFVSYSFDTPAELLTAVGFLHFGRLLADAYHQSAAASPGRLHGRWLTLLVALLAFGGQINAYLLNSQNPALNWMGSFYAILLAGMMAGFYFRFAGILSMLFIVTGFWWLGGVMRADFNFAAPRISYRLDHVLYIYGFGLLGIRMRDALAQTITRLWNGAWFRYLLLYLLLLISLIPLDTAYGGVILAAAFWIGIAVTLGLNKFRLRLSKAPEVVLKGGWLSLASIAMMGFLVYSFSKETWQQIAGLVKHMTGLIEQIVVAKLVLDEDELVMGVMVVAGISLVGLALLTGTIRELLASTHEMVSDVRALYDHWRGKVPTILKFRWEKKETSSDAPGRLQFLAIRVLTWINRVLVAVFVILPLALMGYNAWLDYQKDRDREHRHSDRPPPSEETMRLRQENEKARSDLVSRLMDATRLVLKDAPHVNVHPGDYSTSITTGWYQKPAELEIRRRVSVDIRPVLSFRNMPAEDALARSIRVYLYRQDKGRFNLWVERDFHPDRDQDRILAAEMEQAIVDAALARTTANE